MRGQILSSNLFQSSFQPFFWIRPTIVHQVLVEKFTSNIVGNSGGPSVSRFFLVFSLELMVKGMP
jgi:hypothetical protein